MHPRRRDDTPRLIINPALLPSYWQGDAWGFRAFRNPSRLNSLYLGLVWNFMCLPQRLWLEIGAPLRRADPLMLIERLWIFLEVTVALVKLGVRGRLRMIPLPLDTLYEAHILDEREAAAAIRAGRRDPIRRASTPGP